LALFKIEILHVAVIVGRRITGDKLASSGESAGGIFDVEASNLSAELPITL
jgi:hypothetical protein